MSTSTQLPSYSYSIDPAHSTVRFWVRHLMIAKVHGELSEVTGTVRGNLDDAELAQVEVTIATDSLSTGSEQRDAHLKSPDFLDVEQFPNIRFDSKRIVRKSADRFDVVGELTLHGVTREVTLDAEVTPEAKSPWGGYKVGVSATAVVDREQFGMTWNQALEAGGWMVGKEINLTIDLELDRAE